ncbi:MAG: patatin-like phospholipase family protein [Chthoniobacterales bacterium]
MKHKFWQWFSEGVKLPTKLWSRAKSHVKDGTIKHFQAGDVIRRRGQHSDFVYLLLSGSCESLSEKKDGYSELAATLVPGDAIGETEDGGFSTGDTTIRVSSDSTILQIPRDSLKRVLRRSSAGRDRVPVEIVHWDESQGFHPAGSGKTICFTTLSDEIFCTDYVGDIARTVIEHTRKPVLRLLLNGSPEAPTLEYWSSQIPREKDGIHYLEFHIPEMSADFKGLGRLLEKHAKNFGYVFLEVGRHTALDLLLECIRRSSSTYVFLRQTAENLFEFNLLFRETRKLEIPAKGIKPIIHLMAKENAHGVSQYMEESLHQRVHMYLREDTEEMAGKLSANLRRIGREIADCQVGLVLSSGGARGLAHIGVIQVLEENGIEVDAVAGSSIGAYIAAGWGRGYSGERMEQYAMELEGYKGVWRFMDITASPLRGFFHTERVRKRLEKTLCCTHFSDLNRPIRIIATRLDVLERVVFSGGNVIDAILASIAIPGICMSVMLNGIAHVDGGVSDPLPVDALNDMGIRKIIAVNTIPTPETLRAYGYDLESRELTRSRKFRRKLNSFWNPFAPGNGFDTLLRSLHAAQTRIAEESSKKATIVLRPYSYGARWHDFGNPTRYIALGREIAERQMPEIRALFQLPYEHQTPTRRLVSVA